MCFRKKIKEEYPKFYKNRQLPSTQPTQAQKAKFDNWYGMFIHFGINTFNNTEWSNGKLPLSSYAPTGIDTDQWARVAYQAGMHYVILITKHHDGFCLWDTDTTDYCVKNTSCKIDVVDAMAKSCKKYGIKLGLYYSLWDRHEKCYKRHGDYVGYMETHLRELLGGKYGEVCELWLDGGWDKACEKWQLDRLYDLVKTLQPNCQVGVNLTIGDFNGKKGFVQERYKPYNQHEGDTMRMFPSDFRLWDPQMCREDDPKLFTFKGEKYYLPFEHTVCSRKEGKWFFNDEYEEKTTLLDVDDIVERIRIIRATNNSIVINLPPDKSGRLVKGDVENLYAIAKKVGIYREG